MLAGTTHVSRSFVARSLAICTIWVAIVTERVVAAVLGVTGAVELIAPPTTVITNQFEDTAFVRAFLEHGSLSLGDSVEVDISLPSTVRSIADFTPATVDEGTRLASMYVHYDPVGTTNLHTASGSITLDADILGIIFRTVTLTPTHGQLGNPATEYQLSNDFGAYGADAGQDATTLSADRRTVTFSFSADAGADSLRLLVAVPEPYGDLNKDAHVDGTDFLIWQRGYPTVFDAENIADWTASYGSAQAGSAAVATPEPSMTVLFAIALAGAVAWRAGC